MLRLVDHCDGKRESRLRGKANTGECRDRSLGRTRDSGVLRGKWKVDVDGVAGRLEGASRLQGPPLNITVRVEVVDIDGEEGSGSPAL